MFFFKDLKMNLRYRLLWLNKVLTPFFMFAPFVFIVDENSRVSVLVGLLMWYGLNQFFFCISNFVLEERMFGTFVNLFIYPINIKWYLIQKGLYISLEYILISSFTLFQYFLCGLRVNSLAIIYLCMFLNCFVMFSLSIFYLSLVLRNKRFEQLNSFIQQILGALSGYTSDVSQYPALIKLFSFLIPLTYIILMIRGNIEINDFVVVVVSLLGVSLILFMLGIKRIKNTMNTLRKEGDIQQW